LEAARAVEAVKAGKPIPPDIDYPTVEDGVLGMAFIATAVASANNGSTWTKLVSA
jgi:hypothetical protein